MNPNKPKSSVNVAIKERNICRFFRILTQFSFTTTERELDYHHQKINIIVASRAANLLKT